MGLHRDQPFRERQMKDMCCGVGNSIAKLLLGSLGVIFDVGTLLSFWLGKCLPCGVR